MNQVIKQKTIREIDDELKNVDDPHSRYVTDRVAEKAKAILSLINDKYFEYVDY